jgi:hypothetical protein
MCTPIAPALAKLEYRPEAEFMRLFVEVCMATRLPGFKPQELALVINGEHDVYVSAGTKVIV